MTKYGDGEAIRTVTQRVPDWIHRSWSGRPLPLDLGFYLVCLGYGAILACTNEFYGFRIWGNFAIAGYGLAAAHTCVLLLLAKRHKVRRRWWTSRWVGFGAITAIAMVAPLIVLVIRRLTGVDWLETPFSWSAQPEVWVIERSASLLLRNGTPYVDVTALGRPPIVNDYTPYGPVMSIFGMPRALSGDSALSIALTDARLWFALVACLSVALSLRILRRVIVPIRTAQLAVLCPLTALTFATAGPDLAILGLLILGGALAAADRPLLSAVVLALVVSAKLTAAPAAVVIAVLIAARMGTRAFTGHLFVLIAGCLVVNLPVLMADPPAFIEHVIRFPSGTGVLKSPAASPLPGHLIASTGPTGTIVAFTMLGLSALAIAIWLSRRPPRTGSDAMLRIAVGLGAFALLATATRFGYLVYPCVLLGAALHFRRAELAAVEQRTTACPAERATPAEDS